MNLKSLLAISLLLMGCQPGQQSATSLPVIGLDQNGKSNTTYAPQGFLSTQLGSLISDMSEQVITTLDQHQESEKIPFNLSRVTVGLGLEAEFEVMDETLEAEVENEIELRFEKNR